MRKTMMAGLLAMTMVMGSSMTGVAATYSSGYLSEADETNLTNANTANNTGNGTSNSKAGVEADAWSGQTVDVPISATVTVNKTNVYAVAYTAPTNPTFTLSKNVIWNPETMEYENKAGETGGESNTALTWSAVTGGNTFTLRNYSDLPIKVTAEVEKVNDYSAINYSITDQNSTSTDLLSGSSTGVQIDKANNKTATAKTFAINVTNKEDTGHVANTGEFSIATVKFHIGKVE